MKRLFPGAAMLAALVVAACSPAAAPTPQSTTGGSAPVEQRADQQVLRVGVAGLPSNPTPQSTQFNFQTMWPLYDNLTYLDASYDVKPGIAEKWSLSADSKAWTFNIRKDMTWPNGDKLTAADVAFTLNTINEKNWPQKSQLGNMSAVKLVDDYTVSIELKQPDGTVPSAGNFLWIVPQKYYESVGFDGFVARPM